MVVAYEHYANTKSYKWLIVL